MSVSTIVMNVIFQSFSIGANFWLSIWADDDKLSTNGSINNSKQNIYLGVYSGLGFGQSELFQIIFQLGLDY